MNLKQSDLEQAQAHHVDRRRRHGHCPCGWWLRDRRRGLNRHGRVLLDTSSRRRLRWRSRIRRRRIQRSVWTGRQGEHPARSASVSASSFTLSTSAGQQVTVDTAPSTTYQKGSTSTSASAVIPGERVLALGTTSGTTITATQVILQPTGGGVCDLLVGRGDPLPARCTDHVKAGRSDPGELPPGVGNDRQRHDSEQGDESCAGRLPGGHRRPCRPAEQRRVRGAQHRRQLATPCLRQQELQGRRRRLSGANSPIGVVALRLVNRSSPATGAGPQGEGSAPGVHPGPAESERGRPARRSPLTGHDLVAGRSDAPRTSAGSNAR